MSLILDALRKADAERERGAVPGLHAQPMPLPAPEGRARAWSLPWPWLAFGALVVLAAALAWRVAGRVESRSLVEAPAAASPPSAAAVPAAAAPAVTPAASPAASPAANPPGTPTAAAPPQFVAEPAPWPTQDSRKPAAPEPAPAAKRAASAAPAESAAAPAPASVAAAAAEPPVYAREQLPPQIRAELPPLAFGGAIYSSNPADRSLIVNGRLLRENDRLTGDLTLEQIRLKAAVFRYKGYRFEVGF